MGGSDGLSGQVGDPVMYLVMNRFDESNLLPVEGMPDAESDPAAAVVTGKVCMVDAVSEEYASPTILGSDICSVCPR